MTCRICYYYYDIINCFKFLTIRSSTLLIKFKKNKNKKLKKFARLFKTEKEGATMFTNFGLFKRLLKMTSKSLAIKVFTNKPTFDSKQR